MEKNNNRYQFIKLSSEPVDENGKETKMTVENLLQSSFKYKEVAYIFDRELGIVFKVEVKLRKGGDS